MNLQGQKGGAMQFDSSSSEARAGEVLIIELPSSTPWPMVLALGIALVLTGMVTSGFVSLLGLGLAIMGAVGWFQQVLPHEAHESVPVQAEEIQIASARTIGRHLPKSGMHRQIVPVESFQMTTGIKGGIAGGIAMTVPAALFSLLKYHSIWYATNLLAAGGFLDWAGASDAFLSEFHLGGLLAALVIHGVMSLLVGLLYGAVLPMFPKYPILTAGLLVPAFFSAILYSVIGVLSPILNQRIDWYWFVPSQVAFGLVCGYVVNLHAKVRTKQFRELPFAVRAGVHSDLIERAQVETEDADKGDDPE
jgi:hypothetical protein